MATCLARNYRTLMSYIKHLIYYRLTLTLKSALNTFNLNPYLLHSSHHLAYG